MTKKKEEMSIRSGAAEYLTYVASIGEREDNIEMRYEDENIWLTQKMMATLYDVGTNTINYHIKKIFEDSELQEDSVIRKFRITALDGKSYTFLALPSAMPLVFLTNFRSGAVSFARTSQAMAVIISRQGPGRTTLP